MRGKNLPKVLVGGGERERERESKRDVKHFTSFIDVLLMPDCDMKL